MIHRTTENQGSISILKPDDPERFTLIYYHRGSEERIELDLPSRTLIPTTAGRLTEITRLSAIDTHLLLALVSLYPHYVPDATLEIGYTTDLSSYYQYLQGERESTNVQGPYALRGGINRLKRKVIPLGITVARTHALGYVLAPYLPRSTQQLKEETAHEDTMRILARK